jgi:hypothetical protein
VPEDGDSDPFRTVALVVAMLAIVFVGVLLAIQFGGASAASVVTLPLVIAVPLIATGLYWFFRKQ